MSKRKHAVFTGVRICIGDHFGHAQERSHPFSASRRKSLFGTMGWTAFGLMLFLAGVGWIVYIGATGSGDSSLAFLLLCLGGVLVPLGLIGIFSSWRNWRVGAALYEKGFAYKDASGIRQVSWTDIEAVWPNITRHARNGRYTHTTHV